MSNSDSAPEKNGFRSLLIKGLISGVALAGTTAIPIVVQRSLQPPSVAPASSDAQAPVTPAQIAPLPDSSQIDSAATLPVINEAQSEDTSKGKGKKKRDHD